MCLPSAPVSSTIFFMFWANVLRALSDTMAAEKPVVSPQPPIDTRTETRWANLLRILLTDVNKGHTAGGAWLKVVDAMNARFT